MSILRSPVRLGGIARRNLTIPTVALLTAVLTAASGIVGADTANVAGFPSLFATMTLAPCDVGDDSDEALVDESGAADEAPFEDSEDAAEK